MSYNLGLFTQPLRSSAFLMDLKDRFRWFDGAQWQESWRRTKSRIGGDLSGSGTFHGSHAELWEMFLRGMMREVRETTCLGLETWRGLVVHMALRIDGITYERSLLDTVNAVKVIYSRIGPNLLTNGSGESGAWAARGAATVTQSTEWASQGVYSIKIVATDATGGAIIQNPIAITASTPYQIRVSLNVLSGSWKLVLSRNDTSLHIARASTGGQLGKITLQLSLSDTNDYGGDTTLRLQAETPGGTCYADAAVMQAGPWRAETDWTLEPISIGEYGRIERVILEAGMTEAAATARALTTLNDNAWPVSLPPSDYQVDETAQIEPDALDITIAGYALTLSFIHALTQPGGTASGMITALLGQAQFVTAGAVEANLMDYQIEDRGPLPLWEGMRQIALAGDAAGNRWELSVHGRSLFYRQVPDTLVYHYTDGQLLDAARTPVAPWNAVPGYCYLDDAPVSAGTLTGQPKHDVRQVYLETMEFSAPNKLTFSRAVPTGEISPL